MYIEAKPDILSSLLSLAKIQSTTSSNKIEGISPINKSYLMEKCPDISETTIECSLNSLLNDHKIEKISGGRFTEYKWIE